MEEEGSSIYSVKSELNLGSTTMKTKGRHFSGGTPRNVRRDQKNRRWETKAKIPHNGGKYPRKSVQREIRAVSERNGSLNSLKAVELIV